MIRGTVALFAFALALCAYIVLRPYLRDEPEIAEGPGQSSAARIEVTRAAPEESLVREAPRTTPGLTIDRSGEGLSDLTTAILAGLGLGGAGPNLPRDNPLAVMTEAAVAAIREATGQSAPLPGDPLQAIVIGGLRAGQPDSEIATALQAALDTSGLTVPEPLVTAAGGVDTATLLTEVVRAAERAAGAADAGTPAAPDMAGIEIRTLRQGDTSVTFRIYTVQPADSLAGLALRFYGDPRRYGLILEANVAALAAPERIGVGQKLVIPEG